MYLCNNFRRRMFTHHILCALSIGKIENTFDVPLTINGTPTHLSHSIPCIAKIIFYELQRFYLYLVVPGAKKINPYEYLK